MWSMSVIETDWAALIAPSQPARPDGHTGRIVGRRGRTRRRWGRAARPRQRRWRLDPDSGRLLRPGRVRTLTCWTWKARTCCCEPRRTRLRDARRARHHRVSPRDQRHWRNRACASLYVEAPGRRGRPPYGVLNLGVDGCAGGPVGILAGQKYGREAQPGWVRRALQVECPPQVVPGMASW